MLKFIGTLVKLCWKIISGILLTALVSVVCVIGLIVLYEVYDKLTDRPIVTAQDCLVLEPGAPVTEASPPDWTTMDDSR